MDIDRILELRVKLERAQENLEELRSERDQLEKAWNSASEQRHRYREALEKIARAEPTVERTINVALLALADDPAV